MHPCAQALYHHNKLLTCMLEIQRNAPDPCLDAHIARIKEAILLLVQQRLEHPEVLAVAVSGLHDDLLDALLADSGTQAYIRQAFAAGMVVLINPYLFPTRGRWERMLDLGFLPRVSNMPEKTLLSLSAESDRPEFFEGWRVDRPRVNPIYEHALCSKRLHMPDTVPAHLVESWTKALPRMRNASFQKILHAHKKKSLPSATTWKLHVVTSLSCGAFPQTYEHLSKKARSHPQLAPPSTGHEAMERQKLALTIPDILATPLDAPILGVAWQEALLSPTLVQSEERRLARAAEVTTPPVHATPMHEACGAGS